MKKGLVQNNIYIDTSCLIPYYFNETLSSKVQDFFESDNNFLISELSKVEFYSAARKKVRIGHTTESEVRKVFRIFDSHIQQKLYSIIKLDGIHFDAASNIIRSTENSLRSLDALHLGIAYSENYSVFSYDTIFNQTAIEFGISVYPE
ncbi:type II toxin-antitoxin system VapC family toxin [Gracilimonas sp.]|uniref:type II toxin-antitoxin system VapC family toxin n=1 Tax=Gracilimonas sp. TaxID=1974203 RepID=UPI002871629E|nr:type II toxin-antitoxin system VapC family toxin [Gracilimonas sp.]